MPTEAHRNASYNEKTIARLEQPRSTHGKLETSREQVSLPICAHHPENTSARQQSPVAASSGACSPGTVLELRASNRRFGGTGRLAQISSWK